MDLTHLSSEQLRQNLQSLPRLSATDLTESEERLQEVIQELHVHRIELEMQNRTLRESQGELEAALQRYTDLYDHLPIGYVTLTRSGQIMQANLTAAGWLRRDRPHLIGTHMSWFFDAFDAGRFAAHLENCLKTGYESLPDITLRIDSGLLLTVQMSSRRAPASSGAEPLIHTAITNIVKLKQAQEILNDISREQDALSEAISQGEPNPVVAISHFARQALTQYGEGLRPEVKNLLERMECAALRMESTLHHMLEFCCSGTDALVLDPVSLDLSMQHLLVEHRGMIDRRGAEVVVQRSLPCVRASRHILGLVLANVLTHALKAVPSGLVPRIHVTAVTQEGRVTLKFTDETSSSTAPANGENSSGRFRVFEGQQGATIYSGAGVTLAIIRRAVERMNGQAWVDCTADKPRCFNLQLTTA